MPVTVQCFHCNAILDLDDGFRGGVCRCSNCGTLLQVPPADLPDSPPAKKIRPATPPSPTSPITPLQNATSSKLDVGISRGQFESPPSSQIRRNDLGLSSGIASDRIHPTTPIAAPSRSKRRRSAPGSPAATDPAPTPPTHETAPLAPLPRTHLVLWLGLLLAFLITAVFVSLIIYYLYFYE